MANPLASPTERSVMEKKEGVGKGYFKESPLEKIKNSGC